MPRRKRGATHPAAHQPRPSRRIYDEAPARSRGKLPELATCPSCGACYLEGRWTWQAAPVGAYEARCPACERIEADYPDGVVHVSGAFALAHSDEIEGLVRNVEQRERAEHPLKRVMSIEGQEDGLLVKTTDAKLAQSIGRALHKAYGGELEDPGTARDRENLLRVTWTRD